MHTDPDTVLLVGEDIDVMIPATDRPELILCHPLQRASCVQIPARVVPLENRLLANRLLVVASHPETDCRKYLVHDSRDVLADVRCGSIQSHGFVTAGNVEADARGRDGVFVRNDAADGHCIAFVTIRHESNPRCCLRTDFYLGQRTVVGSAEHWDTVNDLHLPSLCSYRDLAERASFRAIPSTNSISRDDICANA